MIILNFEPAFFQKIQVEFQVNFYDKISTIYFNSFFLLKPIN